MRRIRSISRLAHSLPAVLALFLSALPVLGAGTDARPAPAGTVTNSGPGELVYTNAAVKPDEMVSRLKEANDRMRAGDWAGSVPMLEEIVEKQPDLVGAWTALGTCYVQLDRDDDAEKLWRQLLVIDPNLPQVHRLLGQLMWKHGDLKQAEAFHQTSLRFDPDNRPVRVALARLARQRGHMQEALAMFRALLDESPDDEDLKIELGQTLLEDSQFEEAMPYWEMLAAKDQLKDKHVCALADIYMIANRRDEAVALAQSVLERDSQNRSALTIMADAHEFSDDPASALPYLRRLCELDDDFDERQQSRDRLINLMVRLYRKAPLEYTVREVIGLAEDYLQEDPSNTNMRLLLAELRMLDGNLEAAERQFLDVLENDNPNNRRAYSGLFEVYSAMPNLPAAKDALETLERFNPESPFHHYSRAKFASAKGDYRQAYRELDLLEAAGRRGAVASLLYHGLTPSEWSPVLPVNRFREQMEALRQAGFEFITPSLLSDYFESCPPPPDKPSKDPPDRVVMVTFDDARWDAMRYGTPVALDLGVRFTMHIPAASIYDGFIHYASWDLLRMYKETGAWEYGSHLWRAAEIERVPPDNKLVYPLANRLWLEPESRLETDEEFNERVALEYSQSLDSLVEELGRPMLSVAYPMGEVGQETRSDQTNAIAVNLSWARANYPIGFIQTKFCYAVLGDDPLLYKRYELERGATGEEAVEHVLCNHPVYLAWRLRAELASQEGKIYKSTGELKKLREGGYPLSAYSNAASYVYKHLAGTYAGADNIKRITKGPWQIDLRRPYLVAHGEYERDNLESRVWRAHAGAGLNVTPNITLEGRVGVGRLKQPYLSHTNYYRRRYWLPDATTNDFKSAPKIRLKEKSVGVAPGIKFPNGWTLQGELGARELTGRVPANSVGIRENCDRTIPYGSLEGHIKPLLPLDLTGRWERDVVPVANAACRGTTYNAGNLEAILSLRDWWYLYGSGTRYWFSDDNTRDHLALGTRFLIYEPAGLHLGLRYTFDNAKEYHRDYWSPYRLNSFYLEALLRRTYRRTYYNIGLRYGVGREGKDSDIRESYNAAIRQAQADLDQARRQRWTNPTPRALEDRLERLRNHPPEDPEWYQVISAVASARTKLGKHWELNGEISYNVKPHYRYLGLLAGVKYSF